MLLKITTISLAILLFILGYLAIPPQVTHWDFLYKNHDLVTNPITFTVSKPVIPLFFTFAATPSLPGSLVTRSLMAYQYNQTQNYAPGTNYAITVYYIGHLIGTFDFQSPRELALQEIFKQSEEDLATNYPLAYNLPFETANLTIRYLGPKKLEIKYHNMTETDALAQTRAFMEAHGTSPQSHTYTLTKLVDQSNIK